MTVSAIAHPTDIPEPANDPSFDILLFDGSAGAMTTEQWLRGAGSARVAREVEFAAAVDRLAERQWDLLVIDPATAGALDVVARARRRNRWAAVLATLADADPKAVQRIVELRIDGLVFKPLDRQAFVSHALTLASQSHERRLYEQRRVLAIGAHPDDVELACGGMLARHAAEGDLVKILILSRGSAGGDVNIRLREAHKAAELLGASLELGDLQNSRISEGGPTVALIERVVAETRPTHLYTHAVEDTHQDHRAAHIATLAAASGVPNVYCYQAASTTVDFTPNYYVDISAFMEAKLCAIAAYRGDSERATRLHPESITATAAYWGRFAGHRLAEPLRVIRQHRFSPGAETPTSR
jgi:LmbE family N-acetylglucosaminyl deacetylase